MPVVKWGGERGCHGQEAGTVPFCQKIKNFLGSHRAGFPSGLVDKIWMPLAARESGKVGNRAVVGLDIL